MANETQIGKLVIDLQVKTAALEAGLKTAKERLQELESENNNIVNSNKGLDSSFLALAGTITASFVGIKEVISSCISEYNQYTQAMSSLEDVANYTGESMDDFNDIMDDFSQYMTKSDIAATIKNFSLMGMTTEQTRKMMEALTNSAIKNRNANYTVSEAVKVASDGYKQGLSTLSDSAGVTENLSVMLDKYAESIGKTASQLTEEEQNQAYVNRTLESAAPFANAMTEYNESLAGSQNSVSKAFQETQVAYASAIEPAYTKLLNNLAGIITSIGNFISEHESAVSGVTAFVVTLGTLVTILAVVKKAYNAYKASALAAKIAQEGFNAAVAANPLGLFVSVATLAVSAIAGISSANETNEQTTLELAEAQEKYNSVLEGTIDLSDENVTYMENMKTKLEEYQETIQNYSDIMAVINSIQDAIKKGDWQRLDEIMKGVPEETLSQAEKIKNLSDELKTALGITDDYLLSQKDTEQALASFTKEVDKANSYAEIKNAIDLDSVKTQQKEAAQQKINVQTMQDYLNIVKQGNTSSTEYTNAVKTLAEAYSEASTASGIDIEKCQDLINAQQLQADSAWNASQTTIQGNIAVVQTFLEMAQAAANDADMQAQLASAIGTDYAQIIPTLTSVLNILQQIGGQEPTQVSGITPTSVSTTSTPKTSSSSGSSSSTYQNKKLDEYKELIEHKKALDKLSLQDEIDMYEYALNYYAKTTDEKNELREKIYDLNKELAQKERDLIDEQTTHMEQAMEDQKNARGSAYDVKEQSRDYDEIIKIHKDYLNQIMKDTRLSYEERKEIYEDELETIRDYEQQKRDLLVSSIDDTVSVLTSAITKQLEEMQEADEDAINENIKKVEEWKEARIDAINEEYDARIEAIQKELDLLDEAEEQKTRDEEDEEYERKKNRLEQLIAYEHDATNKANYQKQLDSLIADYEEELEERALQDKKDALKAEQDLLEDEQDQLIDSIEEEADKQTEIYNNQLTAVDEYYSEKIEKAQETAEQLLLNAEENQEAILNLLKNYGDAYEITGQSLGEKLAQGINDGVKNNITNIIQVIQDKLDASIESQISKLASSSYNYSKDISSGSETAKTINITQNNSFEQMQEMPSETYRKLNNTSRELAAELAGY